MRSVCYPLRGWKRERAGERQGWCVIEKKRWTKMMRKESVLAANADASYGPLEVVFRIPQYAETLGGTSI